MVLVQPLSLPWGPESRRSRARLERLSGLQAFFPPPEGAILTERVRPPWQPASGRRSSRRRELADPDPEASFPRRGLIRQQATGSVAPLGQQGFGTMGAGGLHEHPDLFALRPWCEARTTWGGWLGGLICPEVRSIVRCVLDSGCGGQCIVSSKNQLGTRLLATA